MKRTIAAMLLAAFVLAMCAACGTGPADIASPEPEVIESPITLTLTVTMPDGTQTLHTFTSTKSTLGEVLRDYGLIECDDKNMITAVGGVEASWEKDQAYWAFYIDGEYAMHGVDNEIIADGNAYAFEYTIG